MLARTFFGYKPLLIFAKALFNAALFPNKELIVHALRHFLFVSAGLFWASITFGAEPSESQPARARESAARATKPPPTFANQQLGRRVASRQPNAETPQPEALPPPRRSRVDLPAAETDVDVDEEYTGDLFAADDGINLDELHEFGHDCGHPGCSVCGGGGGFGLFNGFYVRGEYLAWATSGMNLPPLVTTATPGTARAGAGVLDRAPTSILFGGDDVNAALRSGGRITAGVWFDPCRRFGLEGDYFALSNARDSFLRSSTGNPILARPFFNMLTGRESAELVAFPNVVSGTVDANTLTRFQGAGARLRYVLCCGSGCGPAWCDPCGGVLRGYRLNLLAGYRYLRLNDRVNINENLTSTDTANPGSFVLNDSFSTQNEFHGVDFGTLMELRHGCWTLDLLSKIALGTNHSVVRINGTSAVTENGVTNNFTGGLLAQRTNIGEYSNDRFAVVPELGMTLGYNVTPCLRVVVGYTFIYWSQVARAGDQISRDLNPNLIPPENVPFTGALRPQFAYHFTDFWAQGVNVGLEGRF